MKANPLRKLWQAILPHNVIKIDYTTWYQWDLLDAAVKELQDINTAVNHEGDTILFGVVGSALFNAADDFFKEHSRVDPEDAATEYVCALLKKMIELGADVNVRNTKRQTPLMIAAEHSDWETVKILLEAGANAEAADQHGRGAYYYAENTRYDGRILPEMKKWVIQHNQKQLNETAGEFETGGVGITI